GLLFCHCRCCGREELCILDGVCLGICRCSYDFWLLCLLGYVVGVVMGACWGWFSFFWLWSLAGIG
ncbi:hypothetical protein L9G16_24005, partial [Shewanella sp. A25]|nr:hypothetical protein [Shewanella shenzhenensis]